MVRRTERFSTEALLQLLNHFQTSNIRYNRRIYVNRNLRMEKIRAVGFDMDYTLAIYKPAFETLAWEMALKRLVDQFEFPADVLSFTYDPKFAIRGLVIDMVHGNILKMDRHRHVSRATHGTRPIDVETRNRLYRKRRIHLSKPEYFLVDTLFSLPETHMYAQIVDWLDEHKKGSPMAYENAYRCIRKAVDTIHQDGTLKAVVCNDFPRFVEKDPDIAYTFEHFFYSGKKLFLLTNSDWDYTHAVMSFLFDGLVEGFPHWYDYFELIVVLARKPSFFTSKQPLEPIPEAPDHLRHKVFRGGNLRAFERLLNCYGEEILYIGDHIYGDILRSKKSSTWRTAMIIPEMETELVGLEKVREDQEKWDALFKRRLLLEIEANYQQRLLMSLLNVEELSTVNGRDGVHPISKVIEVSERNIGLIRSSLEAIEAELDATDRTILAAFNPRWGKLFKEGTGHSVFGEQVEDWACLYTGRISNFLSYSPLHYFRAAPDLLPHERES